MKNLFLTACAVFLSISLVQAQESGDKKVKSSKQEKLHIELKNDANPDIYVDGKKFDFPLDLLDPNRIESVNVLKGEKAIKEYNAKNGVVLVTTKKVFEVDKDMSQVKVKGFAPTDKAPMIIIDGEKSDQETLQKLSPDDIESIEVFKGEKALIKFNAPNGAIIVTTKKGKKK